MNIGRGMQELGIIFNMDGLKWSFKNMTIPLIFFVEVLSVCHKDSLHIYGDSVLFNVFNQNV